MRQRYPSKRTVQEVINAAETDSIGLPDGRYVPARSLGWPSFGNRLSCAWAVFTGRADALFWPGGQ